MKSLIIVAAVAALMTSPVRAGEVECKSYTDFWSVDGKPTTTCYTVGAWPDDEQYITPNKPAHEQHSGNSLGNPAPAAPCSKGK